MRTFFFSLIVCFLSSSQGFCQTVTGYNNTTNFAGSAFSNGASANQSGNQITRLVADDIQAVASAFGRTTTSVQFNIANLNTVAVTARPLLRFYDNNGVSGAPGTLIGAFDLNPVTLSAGFSFQTFSSSIAFVIPHDGSFWAGISFDNFNGTTGITPVQLDLLGLGLFNSPTVGGSADQYFRTTAAGGFVSNNPAGVNANFGGSPVANFGWSFVVSVPEPSTYALFALGGVCCLGSAYWYRRRMAIQAETALARGLQSC